MPPSAEGGPLKTVHKTNSSYYFNNQCENFSVQKGKMCDFCAIVGASRLKELEPSPASSDSTGNAGPKISEVEQEVHIRIIYGSFLKLLEFGTVLTNMNL